MLIKLSKNKIGDLKPLKDLINLQSMDLADNAIKGHQPLANLKGAPSISSCRTTRSRSSSP